MVSNAFLGAGNGFYVKFCVFRCRGMSPNSFWASRSTKIGQKPSNFTDLRRIWQSPYYSNYLGNPLAKFVNLWADFGPDISGQKNFMKNLFSTFRKRYWDMLNPKYGVLTPTGGRSWTPHHRWQSWQFFNSSELDLAVSLTIVIT